jgi:hypothetical protein
MRSFAQIAVCIAAALPEDVNAKRTFDAAPVIRLQSNQHRIELSPIIKWLLFQMVSFSSWS